ncbi:terminase TerL endonuclease subunit, partial [Staphylococcus aureus]|uniref:terminase TerL endonuclease subunit n=1 Tax=Staphylococcus aureus TaxID=1280 RepID=UPI003FA78CAE
AFKSNPAVEIINVNAPMYTIEYPYVTKLLNGEIEDDNYFAFVAEQDNKDEIHDQSLWIKSNPLMEVNEIRDMLVTNIS